MPVPDGAASSSGSTARPGATPPSAGPSTRLAFAVRRSWPSSPGGTSTSLTSRAAKGSTRTTRPTRPPRRWMASSRAPSAPMRRRWLGRSSATFHPGPSSRPAKAADLLVVGARGMGGFRGLLLGSVSRRCAHLATVPLVIVRRMAGVQHRGRIVVGVDGSESSAGALRWARREAAVRGCRLSVLHAWQPQGLAFAFDVPRLGRVRAQAHRPDARRGRPRASRCTGPAYRPRRPQRRCRRRAPHRVVVCGPGRRRPARPRRSLGRAAGLGGRSGRRPRRLPDRRRP